MIREIVEGRLGAGGEVLGMGITGRCTAGLHNMNRVHAH